MTIRLEFITPKSDVQTAMRSVVGMNMIAGIHGEMQSCSSRSKGDPSFLCAEDVGQKMMYFAQVLFIAVVYASGKKRAVYL